MLVLILINRSTNILRTFNYDQLVNGNFISDRVWLVASVRWTFHVLRSVFYINESGTHWFWRSVTHGKDGQPERERERDRLGWKLQQQQQQQQWQRVEVKHTQQTTDRPTDRVTWRALIRNMIGCRRTSVTAAATGRVPHNTSRFSVPSPGLRRVGTRYYAKARRCWVGNTGWSKKNGATLHFPKYLQNYWK